jgi:hypothetical protein
MAEVTTNLTVDPIPKDSEPVLVTVKISPLLEVTVIYSVVDPDFRRTTNFCPPPMVILGKSAPSPVATVQELSPPPMGVARVDSALLVKTNSSDITSPLFYFRRPFSSSVTSRYAISKVSFGDHDTYPSG